MTRSTRHSRLRRLAVLVLACGPVAAACSNAEDPLEIGFRRVALDLAFKDAEKALPAASAQVVTRLIEADYGVSIVDGPAEQPEPQVIRRVRVVPRRVERDCPKAPEGVVPQRAAFQTVKESPKVGSYPRHNEGTMTIESPLGTRQQPVPAVSTWDIPAVRAERANRFVSDQDMPPVEPPSTVQANNTAFQNMTEFELTRRLLPGYSVTDTYRFTHGGTTGGDYLYLVKRVTKSPTGDESVFEPSPPLRMIVLEEPQGDIVEAGVVHAAIDRTTGVAMHVQSQIIDREAVDVCGEVVDTFRIQFKEQMVRLDGTEPNISGNEGDSTNYWNIQFDNGLILVREEVHTTIHTTYPVFGQNVPVTLRLDYTTTLDSMEPQPLQAAG